MNAQVTSQPKTISTATFLPNHIFAMLLVIATEIMLFGGFISAFLVAKGSALNWPPLGQPRLPVSTTFINTLALLFSGVSLYFVSRVKKESSKKWLLGTMVLGLTFLIFQGLEWMRLIQFGLTTTSSVYGAFFYLIIGAHAVHAWVGLFLLALGVYQLQTKRLADVHTPFMQSVTMYWYLVVAIWPVLYVLVYLS